MFFRDLGICVTCIEGSVFFFGADITRAIINPPKHGMQRVGMDEKSICDEGKACKQIRVDFGNLMEARLEYPGYGKIVDVKNEGYIYILFPLLNFPSHLG